MLVIEKRLIDSNPGRNALLHLLEYDAKHVNPNDENDLLLQEHLDIVHEWMKYFSEQNNLILEGKIYDSIAKKTLEFQTKLKSILSKNGIDTNKVDKSTKRIGTKLYKQIKSYQKSKVPPKEAGAKLSQVFLSEFKQEIETLKAENRLSEAVWSSLLIVWALMVIHGVVFNIIALVFIAAGTAPATAGIAAMTILAVAVAPFTEEFAKRFAVKNRFPWLYTTIFAWSEFIMYFFRLAPVIGVTKTIIARLLAVVMHYSTTKIQKVKEEEGASEEGYTLAVIVHMVWNLVISRLLGTLLGIK